MDECIQDHLETYREAEVLKNIKIWIGAASDESNFEVSYSEVPASVVHHILKKEDFEEHVRSVVF